MGTCARCTTCRVCGSVIYRTHGQNLPIPLEFTLYVRRASMPVGMSSSCISPNCAPGPKLPSSGWIDHCTQHQKPTAVTSQQAAEARSVEAQLEGVCSACAIMKTQSQSQPSAQNVHRDSFSLKFCDVPKSGNDPPVPVESEGQTSHTHTRARARAPGYLHQHQASRCPVACSILFFHFLS